MKYFNGIRLHINAKVYFLSYIVTDSHKNLLYAQNISTRFRQRNCNIKCVNFSFL